MTNRRWTLMKACLGSAALLVLGFFLTAAIFPPNLSH